MVGVPHRGRWHTQPGEQEWPRGLEPPRKDGGQAPGVLGSSRALPQPSLAGPRRLPRRLPTAGAAGTALRFSCPRLWAEEPTGGLQRFALFVNPGSTRIACLGAGGDTPEGMLLFLGVRLVRTRISGSLQAGREKTLKICLYERRGQKAERIKGWARLSGVEQSLTCPG